MKAAKLLLGLTVVTPVTVLAQDPSVCEDTCVAACESRLGVCMTDAMLDHQEIAACNVESDECQSETCGCQHPMTRMPLDNCFVGCRNWLLDCYGGDAQKTTSEACRPGFEHCQAWCSMNYVGTFANNVTIFGLSTGVASVHNISNEPALQNRCNGGCFSHESQFPDDLVKRTAVPNTAPLAPAITAFAEYPQDEIECRASCHAKQDQCRKAHYPYWEKECRADFDTCQTRCNSYPKTKPSSTSFPPQYRWTWDGTTRGPLQTGRPNYFVPFWFCNSENGRSPCTGLQLMNTECMTVHKGERLVGNGKGDPKKWRSWKAFHGHDGKLDYCKFYPEDDCNGPYYTDCQGSCNLKNIYGKMQSLRCWWNTTVYPS